MISCWLCNIHTVRRRRWCVVCLCICFGWWYHVIPMNHVIACDDCSLIISLPKFTFNSSPVFLYEYDLGVGRLRQNVLWWHYVAPAECPLLQQQKANVLGYSAVCILMKLPVATCFSWKLLTVWYESRHSTVHSGEKPYKSRVCLASFTLAFDLKVHSKSLTLLGI